MMWRLRYKLSLRDLAEMLLEGSFAFTRGTVRAWVRWFAPIITQRLRSKRRGMAGHTLVGAISCYLVLSCACLFRCCAGRVLSIYYMDNIVIDPAAALLQMGTKWGGRLDYEHSACGYPGRWARRAVELALREACQACGP